MEPPSKISVVKNTLETYFIDENKLELLYLRILSLLNIAEYELSFEFLTSEEMRQLNLEFRNMDKPTDVLSFPQIEFATPHRFGDTLHSNSFHKVLGDIAICPEICEQNALSIGHTLSREGCFLLIHGILHLCGHDHLNASEEAVMLEQQNLILSELSEKDWEGLIEVSRV